VENEPVVVVDRFDLDCLLSALEDKLELDCLFLLMMLLMRRRERERKRGK